MVSFEPLCWQTISFLHRLKKPLRQNPVVVLVVGTISVSTQTDQEVTHSFVLGWSSARTYNMYIHTYLWSSWDTSSKITPIHPHVHHPMLTVSMKDVAPRDIK